MMVREGQTIVGSYKGSHYLAYAKFDTKIEPYKNKLLPDFWELIR